MVAEQSKLGDDDSKEVCILRLFKCFTGVGPYRVTATILKGVSIRFSKHLDQLETRPNKRGTVFPRGELGG